MIIKLFFGAVLLIVAFFSGSRLKETVQRGEEVKVHKLKAVEAGGSNRFVEEVEDISGDDLSTDPATTAQPRVTLPPPPETNLVRRTPTLVGGAGGDPHFHTLRGKYFGYHGVCDLVLLQSKTFGAGLPFLLHIRTQEREGYSSISNAALKIGHDVIEVQSNGSYFFNGKMNVELPIKLMEEYTLTKRRASPEDLFLADVNHGGTEEENLETTVFNIDLGNGQSVQIKKWKDYLWTNVQISDATLGYAAAGLLGTSGKDGFVARDGNSTISDPNLYGQEWQVLSTEVKLFQELKEPQHPRKCFVVSDESRRRLGGENLALKACERVKGPMKEFCIFDVVVTGEKLMALPYLN